MHGEGKAGTQREPSFGDAAQFDTMLASNPVNQRQVTMQTFEANEYAVRR